MSPAALARLIEQSNSPNSDISIAAAYALGEGGSPAAPAVLARLIEMSRSPNPDIAVAATKALGRLYRRG